MAQTIKVKRSAVAGKAPATTDLELGELGLNTYDGKLYAKKDNGTESIVELSGVSDGAVTNAKVASDAAIAGTKISPDFGSQNVTTTGTATAAALIPSGSSVPTNGVYLPSANNVAISTNGTGRLFVDSIGLVGIRKAVPTALCDAVGSVVGFRHTNGSGTSEFYSDSAQTVINSSGSIVASASGANSFVVQTNSSERLRIDSSGRLGLGTSSPSELLELSATADPRIRFVDVGNADAKIGFYSSSRLGFEFAGTERMSINSTGVGIGTTSPQLPFVCSNGGANGFEIDPTQSTGTITGINSYNRSSSAFTPLRFNASEHRWDTGSTERARIDSSGRLLVGTSTARTTVNSGNSVVQIDDGGSARPLEIFGTANSPYGPEILFTKIRSGTSAVQSGDYLCDMKYLGYNGSGYNVGASISVVVDGTPGTNDMPGRLVFSVTGDGLASPTERMRIVNDGNVLVYGNGNGVAAKSSQGAGTTFAVFVGAHSASSTTTGTNSFLVYTNGNVQNTNNSYAGISDLKLKENIVDAASQWDDLKALQVRKYNFKEETGQQTHAQIGLIAQEVELVSPGLVSESPDRDAEGNDLGTVTKSVNYSVLYMKAVKALQEAMERIEQLESKMAAVKAQLS